MSDIEKRVEKLETLYEQTDKNIEDLARLIDNHQLRVKTEITNLTSHLVSAFEPQIRKIVRDEWEKLNGGL